MTALKQYLGDSVYADVENGIPTNPNNTIYMEPEIVAALNNYIEWVKETRND